MGLLALAASASAGSASAGLIDEKVIPLELYTTPKGRALATTHQARLLKFSEFVYGCLPWVDVHKQSIGFQRPKFAEGDDRYFSTWVMVDQRDDSQLATVPQTQRMSAMFSRFGVDLLRRMAGVHDVVADANVQGFSVVVTWLKPGKRRGGAQPVNESVAVFVDKATALDYLEGRIPAAELTLRVRSLAFDGLQDLGAIPLQIWDDPYMATYKVPNYQPPPGITC